MELSARGEPGRVDVSDDPFDVLTALAQLQGKGVDTRLVFASKIQRFPEDNDGRPQSKFGYGPQHNTEFTLGWAKFPEDDPRGPGAMFGTEIVFPKGPADCPYHAKQFYRDTFRTTKSETRTPPPDPAKSDKGGFDSPEWKEDESNGVNAADRPGNTGGSGDEKGYVDAPGILRAKRDRPYQKDAAYKVVLYDCHNNQVDCITWELHVTVAADGSITKAETTKAKSC